MSFTADDESVFVAGCENGTVVKCSLDSSSSLEGIYNAVIIPSVCNHSIYGATVVAMQHLVVLH